jgi:hypothetical protein
MTGYGRGSSRDNKAHVCRKCDEITWKPKSDFVLNTRVFWICSKCENI